MLLTWLTIKIAIEINANVEIAQQMMGYPPDRISNIIIAESARPQVE